ncbi:CaiB/BaiF CoA transferase family protein [Thermodesulfobacteriota bacterium]
MAGPLAGVRVLDLTRALAGPYGSMILGDLGAEIIKVEARETEWDALGVYRAMGMTKQFAGLQRNKKSMTLDLKTQKGKEIFYELVKGADVVFDNYRPDVPERLGVDYDTLSKINPRIICCSITGFGSTGPYRNRPSYDLIAQAIAGGLSVTGEPGGPPCRAGMPIGDKGGGVFAAIGILAALHARDQSGVGQKVETSLMESQVALMSYVAGQYLAGGGVPQAEGSGHRAAVPYGAYKTEDGYIAIAAMMKFPELCTVLGREDLLKDERFAAPVERFMNRHDLDAILDEAFPSRTSDEWMKLLVEQDIPCSPVYSLDQTVSDPQVLDRKMVVTVQLDDGDETKIIGNPIKMSGTPCDTYETVASVGRNTDEILSGLLGYSQGEIEQLRREEVI